MTDKPKKKVALFIGNDITAHLVLNKIVPEIMDAGYTPIIFLPKHKTSEKANLPQLKEMAFFERALLNDVVYPYLNGHTERSKPIAPEILAKKYGLTCIHVPDINDPKFIARQKKAKDYVGALSVRCFQIFKAEHIQVWREKGLLGEKGFLLNLHPGVLPEYQGVMSVARAIADEKRMNYGWTLHHIDEGIDTGNILAKQVLPVDKSKTVLKSTIDLAESGARSIVRIFEDLSYGQILEGTRQPPQGEGATYYSYPTSEELGAWSKAGIRLVDAEETVKLYTEIFSDPNTPHGKELKSRLRDAVYAWQQAQIKDDTAPSSGEQTNAAPSKPGRKKSGMSGALRTAPAFSPAR